MTFTPGSDEGRTDTFEAQTATPDRDLDKQIEKDFSKAQSGIKSIAEGLYNFGKGTLFLTTGGSVQATQALDALRAKIEGKKGPIPSPNPNNLGGLITLEQITTEEAFTRPDVAGTTSEGLKEQLDLPPVTDGPTNSLLELYGGSVSPEMKEILAGITAKMKGGTDEISIPPKGTTLKPNNPEDYKNQAMFDDLTDVSQYDRDTGERLETFGETVIEKGARGFREEAAEVLAKQSAPNVTPQMQAALTGSLTDIPAYKNIVGNANIYDYNVIRELIKGGGISKELGLTSRGVTGRDYLERFQTPVTAGGADRGVDFGIFRKDNLPKLKEIFGPALDALGLPRNAAQIHHVAALHAISGIHHRLGYNSQIYREVNDRILAELPNFKKGVGSMSENLMPIIAGSSDAPHNLTHMFYQDVLGKDGGKFFTSNVLNGMVKSRAYRLQKATELGKIIAKAEKIASEAQTIYNQMYGQGTNIPIEDIVETMIKINNEGFKANEVDIDKKYQVKTLGVLIKNINFALEVQQLKPSADVMVLLSGKNRELELLRDVTQTGGTSTDAFAALKKLYGKTLGKGMKQLTMFEDLLDVKEFLSKYRILSQQKREDARVRRNQAKYNKKPNP